MQLVNTLKIKGISPYAIVEQSDGGPDHNIKFLRSKLAQLAKWLLTKADALGVMQGGPGGSYLNVVERAMSLLNLPLMHVALMRNAMPGWAEEVAAKANGMEAMRKACISWANLKEE